MKSLQGLNLLPRAITASAAPALISLPLGLKGNKGPHDTEATIHLFVVVILVKQSENVHVLFCFFFCFPVAVLENRFLKFEFPFSIQNVAVEIAE